MVEEGGIFAVKDQKEMRDVFNSLMNDRELHKRASCICQDYVQMSVGATQKIISFLDDKLR